LKPTILVASKNQAVLAQLYKLTDINIQEAMTTDGVRRNLSACHLAVVDIADLQEGEITREELERIISASNIAQVTGERFLEDIEGHLKMVRQAAKKGGSKQGFAPRTVALVSPGGSGGGVGKTTLALHAARRFRAKTGLPVLVGEFCFGASGLMALTGAETPTLYDLVSNDDSAVEQWHGVSLSPLDYAMGRLRPRSDYEKWYNRQKKEYTLVLLDVAYPNDLFPEDIIDHWLVIAHAGRRDTIFSALRLQEMLRSKGTNADILVNNYHRGDGLLLKGIGRIGDVPYTTRATRLDGQLGGYVLNGIYPNWLQQMEKKSILPWRH